MRAIACEAVKVDTFGGTVHVEWDPDAAVTPLGHLAFFAEYLKVSGRSAAPSSKAPASEVITPPPKSATTARPSRRANRIAGGLHSAGIGELLCN